MNHLTDVPQTQSEQSRQICSGMYSKKAWGGSVDPFITAKFIKDSPEGLDDPLISLVIYEWKDEDLIGIWPSPEAAKVVKTSFCIFQNVS